MSLSIESLVDDLIAYLRANYPAALTVVQTGRDQRIPVIAPRRWIAAEWNAYKPYELPAAFVTAARSRNQLQAGAPPQLHDSFQHALYLALLIEGTDEEVLTRSCYRYAEAAYAC